MDGVFTPIFVILMVTLLVECLSLLLHDFGLALCSRLIILLMLYLAFVIKRGITIRAIRHRHHKLIHFHSYVMYCTCLISTLFQAMMLLFAPFRVYSISVILISLPIAIDEYLELQWLHSIQIMYKKEQEESDCDTDVEDDELSSTTTVPELRSSLYYKLFRVLSFSTSEKREGIV